VLAIGNDGLVVFDMWGLRVEPFECKTTLVQCLLGAGVFGDGFRAFADGMLCQLTGQEKTDGGLDLSGGDRRSAVVVSQTTSFGGDSLEDVVNERVHYAHCFARDAGVGMYLLQDLVNVDAVALPPPLPSLLVSTARGLSLASGLLRSLRCWLRSHRNQVEE